MPPETYVTTQQTTSVLVSSALAAAVLLWCLLPSSCRIGPARDPLSSYGRAAHRAGDALRTAPAADEEAASRLLLLEAYRAENEELRRSLNFIERNPSLVAAEVISYGGADAWSQRIRLGKGRLMGIRPNAPVVVPDGLVGHVVEVTDSTADVLLISDANSRVSCEIPDLSGQPVRGLLCGAGPSLPGLPVQGGPVAPLRIDFLDRHAALAMGGVAVTSGLGGIYPRGIAIGTVRDLSFADGRLYQQASVAPAAPLSALRTVFVLTGWEASP